MFSLKKKMFTVLLMAGLVVFPAPVPALDGTVVTTLSPSPSPQESITIDFNNVDIRMVIKYLSELTKTNFVIDPGVNGKVTVISPQKMTLDEATKVLETLLAMNGYAIVESDGVKRVVPSDTARQSKMQTWIGKEPPAGESETEMVTQIVPLDYADAEKVKAVLLPYVTPAGHVTSYSPTNTLIISDSTSNLSKLLSIVRSLDDQIPLPKDDLRVIALKNASAKEVAGVLNTLFEEQRRQQSQQNRSASADNISPPSIVAHEGTNSLIVTASAQDFAIVEKTVKQMDVLKDQVYVEVLIVEMTLDKVAEYGLEFAQFSEFVYGTGEGFDGVTGPLGTFRGIFSGGGVNGIAAGVAEGEKEIGGILVPEIGLLVKAFEDDSDVNILSTPQLVATDNEQARILVGNRIAFIKNSQVTAEGGTVSTFEFRDIGLELVITPHISNGNRVRLEVEQRTEDVVGESFEGAPETAKRETKTTVSVRDKGTIVLGGLIRDNVVKRTRKVPILGDIPILKAAFRTEENTVEKMNLLVFLTPYIMHSAETAESIAARKKEELKENYRRGRDEIKQIEDDTLPRSAFKFKR